VQQVAPTVLVSQRIVGRGGVEQRGGDCFRQVGRLEQEGRRQVGDEEAEAGGEQGAGGVQRLLRRAGGPFLQREALAGEAAGGFVVGQAQARALHAFIFRRRVQEGVGQALRRAQGHEADAERRRRGLLRSRGHGSESGGQRQAARPSRSPCRHRVPSHAHRRLPRRGPVPILRTRPATAR
jgi:hypothetical protein